MNPTILALILKAAQLIVDPTVRANITTLNAAIDALIDTLSPDLPEKADGSPWTAQDVTDLKDQIVAKADAIKARMQPPT